jgi:hypothetical protein
MTLTLKEIETALDQLVKRHPDIDTELLTTLLTASGWEKAQLKDATLLFKQKYPEKAKEKPVSQEKKSSEGIPSVRKQETISVPPAPTSRPVVRQQQNIGFFEALFQAFFGGNSSPKTAPATIQVPLPPKEEVKKVEPPKESKVNTQPDVTPQVIQQKEEVHVVATPVLSKKEEKVFIPPVQPVIVPPPVSSPQVVPVSPPKKEVIEEKNLTKQVIEKSSVQKSETPSFLSALFRAFFGEPGERGEGRVLDKKEITADVKKEVPLPAPPKKEEHQEVRPQEVTPPPVVLPEQRIVSESVQKNNLTESRSALQREYATEGIAISAMDNVAVDDVGQAPVLDILPAPVEQPPVKEEKVTTSLIETTVSLPEKKQGELPHNLPIVPFESSNHVWALKDYKETFHKEKEVEQKKEEPVSQSSAPAVIEDNGEEDIVLESVPLTRGDESLVFMAGVMLLVIILILGYMYSNGRL